MGVGRSDDMVAEKGERELAPAPGSRETESEMPFKLTLLLESVFVSGVSGEKKGEGG